MSKEEIAARLQAVRHHLDTADAGQYPIGNILIAWDTLTDLVEQLAEKEAQS